MRVRPLMLALCLLVGLCGWAAASPLLPRAAATVALDQPSSVETARWRRHRHWRHRRHWRRHHHYRRHWHHRRHWHRRYHHRRHWHRRHIHRPHAPRTLRFSRPAAMRTWIEPRPAAGR